MLAAPINPSDINMIEGKYPIVPKNDIKIGGNEGVALIQKIGPKVTHFSVGDHVIPRNACLGTWTTHSLVEESDLTLIPKDIPKETSASISVNPTTAFCLLNDFVSLKKGDLIIQNAANSSVGKNVIQIAKEMGVKTVNLIRNRPNFEETKSLLVDLGANFVFKDNNKSEAKMIKEMIEKETGKRPCLGLNAVGGESVVLMSRLLREKSVLVTYGGMSKKPLTFSTSSFIFKDLTCKGFWMSKWNQIHSDSERKEMFDYLAKLIRKGKLKQISKCYNFNQYELAISEAQKSFKNEKVLLIFDE